MRTRRQLLTFALVAGLVGSLFGCGTANPAGPPRPGSSLMRGDGSFRVGLHHVEQGQVVCFLASAITNIDTVPIVVRSIVPALTPKEVTYQGAWETAGDMTPVAWQGTSAELHELMVANAGRSFVTRELAPGDTLSNVLMCFDITTTLSGAVEASGVQVAYGRGPDEFQETLTGTFVLDSR